MSVLKTKSFVQPCPGEPARRDLGRITMNAVTAGAGRPIVFLHGIGWDHTLWGGAMARFAGDYLTIAADTCGHGATDKPAGPYSVEDFAADWAALIGELAGEPALVVGFSLGGMIAQTLALDYPETVGALVLVNTCCRSPSVGRAHMAERINAMREQGPQAAAMLAAISVFSESWRETNPALLADFVDWRVAQDHRALGEAMRAASNFDLCDRVGSIAVPTMVITALGDELMLPGDQALLKQLIPHAECVEIENSGHMIPIELAEAFESTLADFAARHWPAGGERTEKQGSDIAGGSTEESIR